MVTKLNWRVMLKEFVFCCHSDMWGVRKLKTKNYVSGWVPSCTVTEFPDESTLFVNKFWLSTHSLPFVRKRESPFCGYSFKIFDGVYTFKCKLILSEFQNKSLLQLGHFYLSVRHNSYVKSYCVGTECHFIHSRSHSMNWDHLPCIYCFQMVGN